MKETSPQWVRYSNLFKHVENPGRFFANKFGLIDMDPLEFTLVGGVKIRVPKSRLVEFKCIVMDNCYLKGFNRATAFPKDKELTVVDLGGNLGFGSIYLKSQLPNSRFFTVEPLETNYNYLVKNLEYSGVTGVTPILAAASSQEGKLTLYSGLGEEFPTDSSSIAANGEGQEFVVDAIPLEKIFKDNKISEVDLFKVDIEGAEFDIFYNSDPKIFDQVRNITMEVHPGDDPKENIDALSDFLRERGFHCYVSSEKRFIWASKNKEDLSKKPN